ncbi:MAG: hypothetical protein JRF42_15885 [Deltaproteobacteria bacterium]|nr:hypothetical protein [Deltaproteobacteria bacterium]
MGKLLSELGVRESDLLSALRVVDLEPTSALERAVERPRPAGLWRCSRRTCSSPSCVTPGVLPIVASN